MVVSGLPTQKPQWRWAKLDQELILTLTLTSGVSQLIPNTYSLMFITITVQVFVLGKTSVRKGPSHSKVLRNVSSELFPAAISFLMLKVTLSSVVGRTKAACAISSVGCWGLLCISRCGPCWHVCHCTGSHIQPTLLAWCLEEHGQSSTPWPKADEHLDESCKSQTVGSHGAGAVPEAAH